MLARAFEGLSPEQRQLQWDALKKVVAAPKAPAAAAVAKTAAPRDGSKISQVIAMLRREGGTTLEEIMATMKWQKHTTRAMLSAGGALSRSTGWRSSARRLATGASTPSKPEPDENRFLPPPIRRVIAGPGWVEERVDRVCIHRHSK
jgi:hypothetical protein